MSAQGHLFESDPCKLALDVPIAREKDPESSHLAAAEVTETGTREGQLRAVLDAVRSHPGKTSRELTRYCRLDRYAIARRLPELEAAGAVARGEMRTCTVGNREAITWRAAV